MPDTSEHLLIHTDQGTKGAEELLDWIRDADGLRGRVALPQRPIGPGEMGGALGEIVVVAMSSGAAVGIVTALARTLSTWLGHRRTEIAVTITGANGKKVVFKGSGVDIDTNEVLEGLRALVDPPAQPR
ncbi:hypothetical protein [Nocardia sp. NPDC057353]|uniref:effector-associated constant component EACC1 n=1 Tax=Nocardia sp. NPDC057353 TaxID=3346104 RepID=UPI0036333A21